MIICFEKNKIERQLFATVKQNTPEYFREPLFSQDKKDNFTFLLTGEKIEQLKLWDWFKNYKKEAQVSTAGIRGPQNVLYPWDTRFPINQIGIVLATLGKSLVALEKAQGKKIRKIAGCEVRYNSKKYVELIARIQAAQGIDTYVLEDFHSIPIWMVSFLIFKLDLDGGEHVTSSHSVSTKNATKDLNDQGSQYLPEESMEFVNKIEEILKKAEESEGYTIRFSALYDKHIDFDFLEEKNDGVNLYVDYLKKGVATDANLKLIREANPSIVVDCVGGCMYRTMRAIFENLGILEAMKWLHVEEDPLFHNIGKIDYNPKTGEKEYFDLGCDFSILEVVKSADYKTKLKEKGAPVGTVIEVTDPDGDRLIVCEIEKTDRKEKLKKLGIEYLDLDKKRILSIYTPNQSFLMTMDFHMKQLKQAGLWDKHPRFIIKTTPSAMAWEQWAHTNEVKVVNVPVGFKEIAAIMKKVERQLLDNPNQDVVVRDVYGNRINLGVQPRLVFAGEESGGMITGPEELIESNEGRKAIAMREKSAGEAMVLVTALAAHCKKKNIHLSDYLEKLFEEIEELLIAERKERAIEVMSDAHNRYKSASDYLEKLFEEIERFLQENQIVVGKYDIREDITYYNESEPDPEKLKAEKREGEKKRDKNDRFFLGIAIALRENKINLEQACEILADAFPELDFSNLEAICFVGDGTYFNFSDKFVEIRKSGTDAKTKAYSSGANKDNCRNFAQAFGQYSGELTDLYKRYISEDYLEEVEQKARCIYREFLNDGMSNTHQ